MQRFPVLVTALLLVLTGVAAAQEETVLEVGAQGLVTIAFPNGMCAEMYPVIEGPDWAYSDCTAGEPTGGTAADLAGDGLTVSIPVRGGEPANLSVLIQLQVDPDDPRAVRFSYQFTAPDAVKLNCAKLAFRLPIQAYTGQSVRSIEGPATTAQMPAQPLSGGHILNATARGAALAEGQPQALRAETDTPGWCILDDSRRWTGVDEYSLQLCAVVAPAGTSLAAGQSVSVSGLVEFGSPVRIQAAEPGEGGLLSFTAASADVSDPWFPRLVDGQGTALLSVDLMQLGQPDSTHPEPQEEGATVDPVTGEITATARLYANAEREAYLDVVRHIMSTPGSLRISDELTARGTVESYGVMAWMSLAPRIVEEGRHAAVLINEAAHAIPLSPDRSGQQPVWETALGIRLQTTDGQAALELGGDLPRTWGAWPGPRGCWLQQRVAEAQPAASVGTATRPDGTTVPVQQSGFSDGSTASHVLSISWPR
jgi:hypothetical protein